MSVSPPVGRRISRLPPLVVLAAGRSSRLGEPKGLVRLSDGRVWIAAQLERFAAAGGTRAVVVVRSEQAVAYQAALGGLGAAVVVNPRADELGPFSSLQLGLSCVPGGAFVCPVDVPFAGAAVWRGLAGVRDAVAVLPIYQACGGHPVLLSVEGVARVSAMDPAGPGSRLDRVLSSWGAAVVRVPVKDPSVVSNLNSKGDWAELGAVFRSP